MDILKIKHPFIVPELLKGETFSDLTSLEEPPIPASLVAEALGMPPPCRSSSPGPMLTPHLPEPDFGSFDEDLFLAQFALGMDEPSAPEVVDISEEMGMHVELQEERMQDFILHGRQEENRNRPMHALRAYVSAAALNSATGEPWLNMGDLFFRFGHLPQAIEAFVKAVEVGSVEAHLRLADIGARLGNGDIAVYYYTRVLEMDPLHAGAADSLYQLRNR